MEDLFGSQYVTTKAAAQALGYTLQHTRLLCRQGHLKGLKLGRDWMIDPGALALFRLRQSVHPSPSPLSAPARDMAIGEHLAAVNVAQVPQLSPFRYPGGKTWLIPYVRLWLGSLSPRPLALVEPFAGGAIASLTAVFEGWVDRAMLMELDDDVASVWHTILKDDAEKLVQRIAEFKPSLESAQRVVDEREISLQHRAFATIVRNRLARGGILAPGAGFVKSGENGRGLASRWYPETLCRRIREIARRRDRFIFMHGDGMGAMLTLASAGDMAFFVDPPYTVAGRRLYTHSEVDHARLFAILAKLRGPFMATYDDAEEIRELAKEHGFSVQAIAMKTTHHLHKQELLISRDLSWLPTG